MVANNDLTDEASQLRHTMELIAPYIDRISLGHPSIFETNTDGNGPWLV
jgi:hypothetical protein